LAPISSTYRDYTIFEQPPVSQGLIILEIMNILENFSLAEMTPTDIVHAMVEAKKLAFEDRIHYLEDPRFGDPKVSMILSKEHARRRKVLIGERARSREEILASLGGDTTYLCAADSNGNAVSLIQSVFAAFGSRVVAGDTGIIMNNRLSSFGLDPKKANSLKPGKRPVHTLNSYMVFRENEFFAVGGTPGADDQPQTNVQILHHLLDLHMDPQTAIELPRWSHRPGTPPNLDMPQELRVEEGVAHEVVQGLEAKGHNVKVLGRWQFGGVELIVRDPGSGTLMAGADPRREGYAIGW
jgi:gamma-glutamyltranspeptidase/glutathione hydrolase